AALVNDGVWQPLRKSIDDPIEPGKHLLSPEASFLVLKMLQDTPRDDLTISNKNIPIAWKTGTSSGNRDAWSVGVFGPYVMVVWIGNFNNKSNPAFIGRTLAAPLLFELINALNIQMGPIKMLEKNMNNLNITQIPVCKASGMLPTPYCKETEFTWFIPGKSPIKTDTIFREVAIDKKTGLRTCHINNNTRFDIYEFWSSDLLSIFRKAGIQRRTPPPFDESCSAGLKNDNGIIPQITSPQTELSYALQSQIKGTIPFTATVDADVLKLYWFIGETLIGVTDRNQPYLWVAKAGKYIVRVVDDHGRADMRNLNVTVVQ
ncbi:MAG: penicillin-binding protein 1C, partial [Gammaproteobacteria bacterium]|nr:penicillin-binding protein 1C [Gammaproteobacteria bacterium]